MVNNDEVYVWLIKSNDGEYYIRKELPDYTALTKTGEQIMGDATAYRYRLTRETINEHKNIIMTKGMTYFVRKLYIKVHERAEEDNRAKQIKELLSWLGD